MIHSWAPLTPHFFSIQLEWRWAERITIRNFFRIEARWPSSLGPSCAGRALAVLIGIENSGWAGLHRSAL
jgi:hypothetical protein